MRQSTFFIVCVFALFAATTARAESPNAKSLLDDAKQNFQPIAVPSPASDPVAAARIELGRRLFFENRVSMDSNVSCAHCHPPENQASDGLPKAIGVFGKENPRNAPSVFNFYDNLIDGPTKSEFERWNAYNISVVQSLFNDRLVLQGVVDHQEYLNGNKGIHCMLAKEHVEGVPPPHAAPPSRGRLKKR